MTARLFLDDPVLRTMSARVLGGGPEGVLLDRTVFYARSGGQPGDCGVLRWDGGEIAVLDTLKGEGDGIRHLAGPEAALPPVGTVVEGELEWPRRHVLMRMHTALHLLCAALPGAAVTGGAIGTDKSRLDFDLAEPPAREALEARLNALIGGDHAVTTEWVDEALLDTNPELVRTLSVKPPRGSGRVRLVRIGTGGIAVDLQPCGGTHVARTGEIGVARIGKIENKGKQNRRITVVLEA